MDWVRAQGGRRVTAEVADANLPRQDGPPEAGRAGELGGPELLGRFLRRPGPQREGGPDGRGVHPLKGAGRALGGALERKGDCMNILAFESSCDETAAAVVRDGRTILSSVIASSADMHAIRVVPGAPQHGEEGVPRHVHNGGGAAGHTQAQEGRLQIRVLNIIGRHMTFYMVNPHQRLAGSIGDCLGLPGEEICVPDLAASFQNAVVEVLVERSVAAAREYDCKKLAIAGGVASNHALREAMKEACQRAGIRFYHPSPVFCTPAPAGQPPTGQRPPGHK